MEKQNDRVSFSFGMKLSLPAKYETADFHVSLASDVQSGETAAEAFERVRREVALYAGAAYQQIRASEEGLLESSKNEPAPCKEAPKAEKKQDEPTRPESTASPSTSAGPQKPRDLKALKQQIKLAFGVLESQKKVTKAEFVSRFLQGKKTDDLNEIEVTNAIVELRLKFPELKI